MKSRPGWRPSQWIVLAVILLGWALALVQLGKPSLWADEGATAYQAQQAYSIARLANLHKDYSFLHLSLMTGIVRLSRHEMALRFPSAVAAVLTLPVVYVLGRRLFDQMTGLLAAFLLSISPFAIGYAQEARVYALFELLACLSLLFLLLALAHNRWPWWVGFVISTALLLYAHLMAWFVVGAELLFAFILLTRKTVTSKRLDSRLPWLAASLGAVLVLYLPLARPLLIFWQQFGPGDSSPEIAGLRPFQLSPAFFIHMGAVFGARAYGWQLYLFGGSILLGFVSLVIRKRWEALLLIALWFAVPLSVLSLLRSQHFFEYRYLIFMLPLFLLMTAEGVASITALISRSRWLSRFTQAHLILGLGLACLLFMPAHWPALQGHYQWEKENWRGIGHFVGEYHQSDEAILVAPRFWAFPLLFYQPSLESYLVDGNSVDQLLAAAQQKAGTWYLRFAAPFADPTGKLTAWIKEQQFQLLIDGRTCGRGIYVYYRRFDDLASARQAELLRHAAAFCPTDPRFQSPPQ